jgi:hypothetical protein
MAVRPKNVKELRKLARECVERERAIAEFQDEVNKLAKKRGIDEIRRDLPMMKQRVLDYMHRNDMKRLELGEDGYVNCIQATSEHVWIATKADIPKDAPVGSKPLRSILGKELFQKVTRRVVDPTKLQAAIEEGEISEDAIAPAHFTRKRAPYIKFERTPA